MKILKKISIFLSPTQKLRQMYLTVMCKIIVKKSLYCRLWQYPRKCEQFICGIADIEQQEGQIFIVKVTLLIEVEYLEQKFYLLLVPYTGKDD
jgi:hypothetical protein